MANLVKGISKSILRGGPTPEIPKRPWDPYGATYKFFKKGGTIPGETASGQTMMWAKGVEGLMNKSSTPPFKSQGYGIGDPRAKVMGKARSEELSQKAAVAGVRQQFKMDAAVKAGQITDRELVRQNRIIMRRRKRAV